MKLRLAILLAATLAQIVAPFRVNAQQTQSEQAALSERGLFPDEVARKVTYCPLPVISRTVEIEGTRYDTVRLEDLQFLVLVTFQSSFSNNGTGEGVAGFPHLPFGGIGFRDHCEPAILARLTEGSGPARSAYALRLVSALDVATDYPSSMDQIKTNKQLAKLKAREYLKVTMPAQSELDAVVLVHEALSKYQKLDGVDGRAATIWMNGTFYIPLVRPEERS